MVLDGSRMAKEMLWKWVNPFSFKTSLCKAVGAQNILLCERPICSVYFNLPAFQSIEILPWITAKTPLPLFIFFPQLYDA